jgi:hypothetical protein
MSLLQAEIVWNIQYDDVINGSGTGFDDLTEGQARRNTIDQVTGYLSDILDYDATLDLRFQSSQSDGSGFLASAGTYYPGSNGFSNGLLYEHLNLGFDPVSGLPDGLVTFDFGYNWNTGLDTPIGSEFDMFSVALHEITHTLGFSSLVTQSGVSELSGTNPGSFSVFDSFVEKGDGTKLFDSFGTFLGTTQDLVGGDLYFGGENAKLANGGEAIKLYVPGTFQDGSSVSHLDFSYDSVMNPGISSGVMKREYSEVDFGILKDLGYQILDQSVAAVPEPKLGSFLMLVGFVMIFRRHVSVKDESKVV